MSKVTNLAAWRQKRADRFMDRVRAMQAEGHSLSAALDIAMHEAGLLELVERPDPRYAVSKFLKSEEGA